PSGTPPLLPIPLPVPSTSRRAKIPKADTPPRKRLLLTTPRPGCEVGESSAAAAARQLGPTMARSVDCSFVDTMETSRESSKFYSRHHDSQKDRAAVRAEIEVLRRERLAYEQESIQTHEALARSEAYSRALEVRVAILETQACRHEWQRQTADDLAIQHIMRTQSLEAGARIDTLEDTDGVELLFRVRNGYDSNGSGPRLAQAIRECTYLDFLKCQPLNFKGTKKMKSCSGIAMENFEENNDRQVLPRGEIKKLETEMWELKTKGTNVIDYSRRFQELALMYDRMFPKESDRVEKYIGGLPDTIHDSVKATKTKTIQEAIEFATELMDKRIRGVVENKRKFEGSKPLCSKCDYHHGGCCPPSCNNCKRVGHLTRDCRSRPAIANNNNTNNNNCNNNNNTNDNNRNNNNNTNNNNRNNNNNNNQKGNGCYECGAQGHFKRNCPELKNNNRGNQGRNNNAQARVYVVGNAGANPDNVVTGMDWLSRYNVVIACAEKLVRIPFGNEILTIRGEGSNERNESRLNIISCSKAQEYMSKRCHVFLANITSTKDEDKAKGKRLGDDEKEHEEHLRQILKLLKKEELYAKFSKYPAKIEFVKDWASPKSPTEIRQFLGLARYYERFIEGFSKIAKLMTKLT
nr:hypothetical protein [Tanacetum cinerariifolium]